MQNVNGRRTSSDGKSSHCLWQGELIRAVIILLNVYMSRMILAVLKWVPCTHNWEFFTKLEHFCKGHFKN